MGNDGDDGWVELDTTIRQEWYSLSGSDKGPGKDTKKVLAALLVRGPLVGTQLAEYAGVFQGNMIKWTLPRLWDLEIVTMEEVGVLPTRIVNGKKHGGGRPAQEWSLTRKGRRIAELAFHMMLNERISVYSRMGRYSTSVELLGEGLPRSDNRLLVMDSL